MGKNMGIKMYVFGKEKKMKEIVGMEIGKKKIKKEKEVEFEKENLILNGGKSRESNKK